MHINYIIQISLITYHFLFRLTYSLTEEALLIVWSQPVFTFYMSYKSPLIAAAAAAKLLQSCPNLWDPIDGSPPGSAIPGILQARILEWVAISSPMHESEKRKWSHSVVSNSSRPHGLQPTRLLRPWNFPGKSTGVRWHCLLPPH